MSITLVGSATGEGDSVAGNYDVTLPGGVLAGDIVIVATGFASPNATDEAPGVTTGGYTEEAELYVTDSRAVNLSLNWKIMGSTPDTVVNCIASANIGYAGVSCVQVWRGVNQLTPMDVTMTTATGNNSPTPNSPTITPVTKGAIVLSIGGYIGYSSTLAGGEEDTTVTEPTGYSNVAFESRYGVTAAFHVGIASKAWSGSGAEDPGAWSGITMTNNAANCWAAATIALRPALSLLPVSTISKMQPFLAR